MGTAHSDWVIRGKCNNEGMFTEVNVELRGSNKGLAAPGERKSGQGGRGVFTTQGLRGQCHRLLEFRKKATWPEQ